MSERRRSLIEVSEDDKLVLDGAYAEPKTHREFRLLIETADEEFVFIVHDVEMARELLSEVSKLRTWIQQHLEYERRERRRIRRARLAGDESTEAGGTE